MKGVCLGLSLIVFASAACALPPVVRSVVRMERFERQDAGAPASVVRLYLMPTAPVKLKWGSPRGLLLSTVESVALSSSHPIGHVNIEVQYRGLDDAEHHAFTGATDVGNGISKTLLLKDELGFSILERAWPGCLETEPEVAKSLVERARHRDRLAVATFLVSDATCERLLEYVKELRADTNPRWYGFAARPRQHEGSGCSAFGASFLDNAGLMDAGLRAVWTRTIRVPLALMGGYPGHEKINVAKAVISSAAARWASANEPHMLLECYDPDLMFDWTAAQHDKPGDLHGLPIHADPDFPKQMDQRYHLDGVCQKNVKAIVVDARDVPTPGGSVFTGEQDLVRMNDCSIPTVVRGHKVTAPDGSFETRP